MDMISVAHVTKKYRGKLVVKDVDFQCTPGTITGFLGPNGAGKSTTMRIICGMTSPTAGRATVAGRLYRDLSNPARTIGVMLDARSLSGPRTGLENLRVAARTIGLPKADLPALLDRVGLASSAADKRVADYSLGMRQRLGLAQALLGDPQALILDEPSNGLDPAGIRWMRQLLRDYADHGGTVLLSSHLLHEIEIVADQLVLLDKGQVVARGTTQELTGRGRTLVRTDQAAMLSRHLRSAGLDPQPRDHETVVVDAPAERIGALAADLGVVLHELRTDDAGGLEGLFMSITATREVAA